MEAGKLRTRVRLQRPVGTRSSTGESTTTWHTWTVRWAAVRRMSGRELYVAQQVHSEATYAVELRYLAGVKATHRVLIERSGPDEESQVLSIVEATPDERRRELRLLCKEEAPTT